MVLGPVVSRGWVTEIVEAGMDYGTALRRLDDLAGTN
jgi:hypothetical protein